MENFLKNMEAHLISKTWEHLSIYDPCKEVCKEIFDKNDRIKAINDKIGDVEAVKAEEAEETLKATAKEIFSPAMEEPVKDKIRIVMSSRSLKAVDEATAEVIKVAKGMGLKVWGPCRAPTQLVDIKTGLAPYSKGSSSSGNFKLRIYETHIDVLSSTKVVEEIISGSSVGDVDIETIVVNTGGRRL